jgi:3-hydroxyacyl-[acyl-carrier-protein] dehydratase
MRLEYFQLIDRIAGLSLADRRLRAEATVPTTSTIFEGHFPGYPLMPGVLLVEAMAQASGWLVIALTKFERMALLAQIREAKLRNMVRPGTSLTIDASLLHEGSGFAVTRANIVAGDKPICDAELTLRTMAFPSKDVSDQIRKTAAQINFPLDMLVIGREPA